jgi:hypothetical protein
VITEHAVRQLGLSPLVAGWLIQTPHPLTATQIRDTQLTAASAGLTVETRSSVPSVNQIIDWATVFGVLLALGVLAMSVGLIRSETASDLRTLTATGASGRTRRALTAVTAGALGLLGAVLGVAGGYVAAVGYFRGDTAEGGLSALSAVPVTNLLVLLIGMPLLAAAGGWLLAGREPPVLGRQPIGCPARHRDAVQVGRHHDLAAEHRACFVGEPARVLVGVPLGEVAQHQRADPALGRDLARLPRGQVPEGRGQLGLAVQERRLAHDQVGPLSQCEGAVAEPGVHDEREPLPGPGLAHLVQADSPARHVQAAVAGQPSHVRPADAEGGQPVRPHPAAVRLGQLVAHGRHPVRQWPGQQPPSVRLRQ